MFNSSPFSTMQYHYSPFDKYSLDVLVQYTPSQYSAATKTYLVTVSRDPAIVAQSPNQREIPVSIPNGLC